MPTPHRTKNHPDPYMLMLSSGVIVADKNNKERQRVAPSVTVCLDLFMMEERRSFTVHISDKITPERDYVLAAVCVRVYS